MKSSRIALLAASLLSAAALASAQSASDTTSAPGPRPPHRGGPGHGPLALFDADRDGVLSAAEITASAEVLLKLDLNQDGQIDQNDRPAPPEGAPVRPARPDGAPSGDLPPRPPRGGPGHLLRLFDTNQDGVISGEEIVAAPKVLRALDANGDGSITRDELPQPPARP